METSVRVRLDEITESCLLTLEDKVSAIGTLAIKLIPEPVSWELKRGRGLAINCHAYALGLGDFDEYRDCVFENAADDAKGGFADANFIEFLLQSKDITKTAPAKVGDCILYFGENGKPKHTGLIIGENLVRSKWNSIGIFEHNVWDVPYTYGTKAENYLPLLPEVAMAAFLKYIR